MNKRLEKIADHIHGGKGFADVGTDHGYLPLIMRRRGYEGRIIASDLNEAPLFKAHRCLEEHGLADTVELRLCDGLDGCENDCIDTIVIAGMGGDTITGILDRAEWCMSPEYRLILQPVTKPEILRYWLVNNGFLITDDDFVFENGTVYQIICAVLGESRKYNDAELFVGSYEYIIDSEHFDSVMTTHIKRFEAAANGIERAGAPELTAWLDLIRNMLSQLYAMKGDRHD